MNLNLNLNLKAVDEYAVKDRTTTTTMVTRKRIMILLPVMRMMRRRQALDEKLVDWIIKMLLESDRGHTPLPHI